MRRFSAGFLSALIAAALVLYICVKFGLVPARADVKPSRLERSMARMSLDATIAREAPQLPYPFPSSDAAIVAGSKLYLEQCAICHGTATSGLTRLEKGLYIAPPQFAKHGVDDDPEGVTYWKVEHGIRFTAMPAYGKTLTEEQVWDVTYFLKNMPKLPPAAAAEWHKKLRG
ncbi:MAG: cytochrome c [Candidatus Velthaea sp.]